VFCLSNKKLDQGVQYFQIPSIYFGFKKRRCGLFERPQSGFCKLLQEPSIVLYLALASQIASRRIQNGEISSCHICGTPGHWYSSSGLTPRLICK
jgi:hypothetical protein